jgi:agmatinase
MNTSLSKQDKIHQFNPNNPAQEDSNIFGLPFNAEESDIVILPVPWEVTVSYQAGTAKGPMAILDASAQVDLLDSDVPDAWKAGIHLLPQSEELADKSIELRDLAIKHIESLHQKIDDNINAYELLSRINQACADMVEYVQQETRYWLNKNKIVGLIGGDHSTPLGFIKSLTEFHDSFGILQIDAHCDLRNAYEGFTYSHASIMYNALKEKQVEKLVQVGIRDYCSEELDYIQNSNGRVVCYFDEQLSSAQFGGTSWDQLCNEIIEQLPAKVYVSFDIDGLNPSLCPNTGTPVPGGLEYYQAIYLLRKLSASGKKIIGFDLNEVAPGADEWDANVGARLLFKLAVFSGLSNAIFTR